MPEGEDKEDALIKKAKAEYQILILNRRQKGYENIALSSKELEIKQAEDQILSINDFIAQVRSENQ